MIKRGLSVIRPPAVRAMFAFRGGPETKSPERIEYSPVTLRMLLTRAYDLHGDQVLVPLRRISNTEKRMG